MTRKTRASRAALLALLPFAASGCAALQGGPAPVAAAEEEIRVLGERVTPTAIAECSAGTRRQADQSLAVLTAEEARACRNFIIAARRYAIDARFHAFEQSYFQENRWAGFGTTLAALGLGVAGPFSGATAARALAAGAGSLAGGRAAYEREILAERSLLTINAAMRAERDRIAARLIAGMRLTAAEYPLPLALSDLQAYERAGTVLGALTSLSQTAGEQAQAAQAELDRVSGFATEAPSAFLQGLISAEATEEGRAGARRRIAEAMQGLGLGLHGASMTNFLTDQARVAEHRVIARALGWRPE